MKDDRARSLTLERGDAGIATIVFDTPGSPVNVLSRELVDEIGAILDEIDADDSIRACVLASGKPGTFIAGADLTQLSAVETPEDGAVFSRNGQRMLNRIAESRRPFVAAIHGPTLGGGLEVALACHYRLAADDPKTILALPEVQLGLLPGGAGTQRLPRLIGLQQALPLMLTGKRLRAGKAYRLGLVDALTSPGGLRDTAARAASMLADGKLSRKPRRTSLLDRFLESAVGRGIVYKKATAGVMKKTRGLYPAPLAILECVKAGFPSRMDQGLATESKLFGELAAGDESRHLIGLFDAMTALKKPLDGPAPRPVRRLAVVGGGFMGCGIASVSVAHMPVAVKDIDDKVLSACAKGVHDGLTRRVRSRAITRFQRDQQMARLLLTTNDADLAGADIVVEAVFEELELKRKILAAVEQHVSPEAVFASNTSALPIAGIAETARHPERVLGMHYFSPVPKMPLLEIIVTPSTSGQAVATARALGIKQGKTVIVVQDGPGFYTSRILSPYLNEAVVLIEEGARIEDVDRALLDFGFPVGPLALIDEVGIDVATHVASNLGQAFADRGLSGTDALPRMHEAGMAGRKNKRGFYRYDGKKGKQPNEAVYGTLGASARKDVPAEEITRRVSLMMINEALHCLEQGVIAGPPDGDIGAILGLGFPPFRGGPFRYADDLGASRLLEMLDRTRDACGPRFEAAPTLRELAKTGRGFHPGRAS